MKDHWDASLYDEKHSFVSMFGNNLIEILAPRNGELILDIGCGTGDLANEIYELGAKVTGIDASENMVSQANNKFPHITFMVKDVLHLDDQNKYNAVFSNATLHWVKSPKKALENIFKSLKSGGRFVAEFGGKGNVQFITNEVINQLKKEGINYHQEQFPWYFPSIGEYTTLMEEAGFRVTFAQHFERPTPLQGENGLRNWQEMFAGSLFENQPRDVKGRIMSNVEDSLRDTLWVDGQWIADYKRIRVVGWKE